MGHIKWLIFLMRLLDLIGMWFGEDQRANIIKTHVKKRLDSSLQISKTTLHSTMNTTRVERLMYPVKKSTNMHFL
jgi:hypothetical protein